MSAQFSDLFGVKGVYINKKDAELDIKRFREAVHLSNERGGVGGNKIRPEQILISPTRLSKQIGEGDIKREVKKVVNRMVGQVARHRRVQSTMEKRRQRNKEKIEYYSKTLGALSARTTRHQTILRLRSKNVKTSRRAGFGGVKI